jgi:hypothetical protein
MYAGLKGQEIGMWRQIIRYFIYFKILLPWHASHFISFLCNFELNGCNHNQMSQKAHMVTTKTLLKL